MRGDADEIELIMQDIPRNELLDKLAAGWKVRRKAWNSEDFYGTKTRRTIPASQLLADDWQGEPPEPVRVYERCSVGFAFRHLKNDAKFVRRSTWLPEINYSVALSQHLTIADILATDWEVWA